jgi:hypothetical protein
VTAQTFDSSSQYTDIILKYGNLNNYSSYNYLIVQKAFLSLYGYSIPERVVYSAVNSANPGNFYVRNYGLSGAPSFIYKQYVSPDNTTYLISIILNVPQSYRGANDFYPAQSIVPQIRNYTSVFFHNQDSVTGNGAISYDELRLTSEGFKIAASVWNDLTDFEKQQIFDIKDTFNYMSLTELLNTVYSRYPKFTKRSALKEEVVDKYFADFLQENEITEEDVVSAVNLAKKALRQ